MVKGDLDIRFCKSGDMPLSLAFDDANESQSQYQTFKINGHAVQTMSPKVYKSDPNAQRLRICFKMPFAQVDMSK